MMDKSVDQLARILMNPVSTVPYDWQIENPLPTVEKSVVGEKGVLSKSSDLTSTVWNSF